MFKWLRYIGIGAAVVTLLTDEIPKALEDDKITVGEIVDMFMKVTTAGGFPLFLDLPQEVKDQVAIIHKQKIK